MRNDVDDYERLVGMVYEACLDSGRWMEPFDELLKQIGGSGFHFLGWNANLNVVPFAACSESWREFVGGYHDEYGKIDPHLQAGLTNPVGHWLVSHHRFDERFVSRDACYQEYFIPNGVRYLMGTSLIRGEGVDVVAAVGRPVGADPFSEDDIALVRRITPHLQRAAKLHMRTSELRQQALMGEIGLQAIDSGLVAVDDSGRILFANRFAEKMLRAGTCIKVCHGRFGAAVSQDDAALRAAMLRASTAREPGNVRLRHATGKLADGCAIAIVPVAPDNQMAAVFQRPDLLLMISSAAGRRAAAARDYMELFGLTAAEARVAEGLVAGLGVEEYASRAQVSKETVKAQLQAVFQKTGARRQSELMRILGNVAVAAGPGA